MFKSVRFLAFAFAAILLAGAVLTGAGAAAAASDPGMVFALSNAPGGNAVLMYNRAADGSLAFVGTFPTGGLGTGAGLGSQGSLVLSDNGRQLFAVNAGSNEISALQVGPHGLSLGDKVGSGGTLPISLTVHKNVLYVLNGGAPANITGFRVNNNGTLSAIAGSTRPLSAAAPGPAEVAFSPDGKVLMVTEKATSMLDTYTLDANGAAQGPTSFPSSGITPFGFGFDKRGHAIVSEAATGAVSSYSVADDGTVAVISASVAATGQNAACWIAVTKNGKYAYTTNAASGTITGYRIAQDGSLSLLDPSGVTAQTGGTPIDMDDSVDSKNLYVFNTSLHMINAFRIKADGSLVHTGDTPGLPPGASGIAAW